MTDPRDTLATSPMSPLQVLVVGLTIGLNALDGFDVLSISFASPGIAAEWGIARDALGIVLSMELIGMAIGSVLLGGVADRIGRRPTMLGCLVLMAFGMVMATTASGLVLLSMWRIVTGLGIGGMLAAITAVAAEFSNTRRRHLSVSIMSIGYPLGAVFGGLVAAQLLQSYDWRSVFYFGAAVTASMIPLVYFIVPESVHWLARKQPAGALDRVNAALRRMGHAAVAALPVIPPDGRRGSVTEIFSPALSSPSLFSTPKARPGSMRDMRSSKLSMSNSRNSRSATSSFSTPGSLPERSAITPMTNGISIFLSALYGSSYEMCTRGIRLRRINF